jgi:hypothetical protein
VSGIWRGGGGKRLHAINLHHEVPSCQSIGLVVTSGSCNPPSGALVTSTVCVFVCVTYGKRFLVAGITNCVSVRAIFSYPSLINVVIF